MKQKMKSQKDIIYSLCEAVADIAFIAGTKEYYSGNSRQDIEDFIHWAEEFELKWKNKDWGADDTFDDYMDEIIKFANKKILDSTKVRNTKWINT